MKNRENIKQEYKWKLTDIFTPGDFEKEFDCILKLIPNYENYKGKLFDEKAIIELLEFDSKISNRLEKLYLYAHLNADIDTSSQNGQAQLQRVHSLYVSFSSTCSFIASEISSCEISLLTSLAEKYPNYSRFFERLIANKAHILSEKEEKILALSSDVTHSFSDIFKMLDNADLDFGEVEVNGEKKPLNHSTYAVFLQNSDQNIRKLAFESYYRPYKSVLNTIASNYTGSIKSDCFKAKSRNFGSALEMSLFYEEIPVSVYEKLTTCISDNLSPLHEYIAFRKEQLKLDTINMYDLYCPILDNVEIAKDYDDAYDLTVEATSCMGEEYTNLLKKAKEENWIDVFYTKGKKSGAYSSSAYGIHPFVLLNYEKTTHDVFTIAHEMGHALHSHYSNQANCYEKADYKIFVAEVASTTNEVLLLKLLLKNADANTQKFLLSYYLDMFRTTMFRQTMFSEFEAIVHAKAEKSEPLNAEILSQIYRDLNKKYYGNQIVHNSEISYEWCRIPHFYRAFYVYKYATGLIASVSIANKLLTIPNYEQKYLQFLKSGNTASPIELLKLADIDLESNQPYEFAISEFRKTLQELKNYR